MDNSQENKTIYIAIAVAVLALIALVGGSVLAMRMLGGAKENAQSQLAPFAEAPATESTAQESAEPESSDNSKSKVTEAATMTKTVEQTVTQEYTAPATKDPSSDLPAGFNPATVACDGHGVLIVDSVVAGSPEEALPQLERSVAAYPRRGILQPRYLPICARRGSRGQGLPGGHRLWLRYRCSVFRSFPPGRQPAYPLQPCGVPLPLLARG